MNKKQWIICLFRGHTHTIKVNMNNLEVSGECTRCKRPLPERELQHIMRTSTAYIDKEEYFYWG